ncbi:lipoprotein [Pollutimonas sp. H1-120]|uniref:LPS translocon maturation chaperone LptM n=1 Tax=Pollutimonas sp. H1-120 TaxID=3148824 RepID=UPI003B52D144
MQAPRTPTSAHAARRLAACLALLSMLAACGYKGPLYMPPPPTDETLAAPPAPAPIPAAEAATPAPIQAK